MTKHDERAAGYLRVSTEEQAKTGVSLGAQEAAVRAYGQRRGIELALIVTDGGVSGSTPMHKRPGGTHLLEAIARGDVDGVVALKLDRLFRDAVEALAMTRTWDRSDVSLHLVDMELDTRSAMGRLMLSLLASLAEWERNIIGERTAAALAHVKAQGGRVGREGLGWEREEHVDLNGRLRVVQLEDERETVARMVTLRDTGWSYRAIAAQLTLEGRTTKRGGRWHAGVVRRVVLRERGASDGTRRPGIAPTSPFRRTAT